MIGTEDGQWNKQESMLDLFFFFFGHGMQNPCSGNVES